MVCLGHIGEFHKLSGFGGMYVGNSLKMRHVQKGVDCTRSATQGASSLQHFKSCKVSWPGLQRGRDGMVWEGQMLLQARDCRLCHLPDQHL